MKSASVLRLHTHTVSIRSDKAERLLFVLEKKKKKVQIKNQEKKNNNEKKKEKKKKLAPPPSPVVRGFCWSHTVHPVWGGHLRRGSERAGGSSTWEWRAGWKPAERRGWSTSPIPLNSANHQSRCWWRFRLRTERTSAVNLWQTGGHFSVLAAIVAGKPMHV